MLTHDERLLGAMLDQLGGITDEPGRLTRTFLSPAMERAVQLVGCWLQDAGMDVKVDPVGNLIGRLGAQTRNPKPKTLILGSHLDTVRDAGRFDGPLGVLLPAVALYELNAKGVQLPFNVEIVGFSEEEGVRFASAYLGSEGYTGRLKGGTLALKDANGVSVREALRQFSSKPLPKPRYRRREVLGYVEVHIEQGPVLERENLAVGVVSAIAGQSRFKLTWTGKAGHAGTTPMALRRDAFAGAAEFALAAEQLALRTAGLVATVGTLTIAPGAANVIPGQAVHTLDVRHAKDAVRKAALLKLGRLAAQIARRRGLRVSWQRTQDNGATPCSPELTASLAQSVKAVQGRSLALVSGAGHDGVVMASLAPIAMLFVRSRDGLSHHPDEYTAPKDLRVALEVMIDFLQRLAANTSA
jgi:allantoate deiminase